MSVILTASPIRLLMSTPLFPNCIPPGSEGSEKLPDCMELLLGGGVVGVLGVLGGLILTASMTTASPKVQQILHLISTMRLYNNDGYLCAVSS